MNGGDNIWMIYCLLYKSSIFIVDDTAIVRENKAQEIASHTIKTLLDFYKKITWTLFTLI